MAQNPQFRPSPLRATTLPRGFDQAAIDVGLRRYMLRVYNYMAMGLAISGLVAWAIAETSFGALFFTAGPYGGLQPTALGWIGIFAPLGLLFMASFAMRSASAGAMQTFYWVFVALQGIGLSVLFEAYTSASLVRTFFVTAAAFAGLSLYGYTTRRDLSAFGSFLIMGLIGLILASIVNVFLGSAGLEFVISAAGVLIFSGLTAYDTQAIKEQYVEGMGSEMETKTAVWGALTLYITFLNLFQFLLAFMGQRD